METETSVFNYYAENSRDTATLSRKQIVNVEFSFGAEGTPVLALPDESAERSEESTRSIGEQFTVRSMQKSI